MLQRSDNLARADELLCAVFRAAFLPGESVKVSEYAARHRWMANHGGGYVGMWSHEEAPYLIGPMDSLVDTDFNTTVIVGPGQCGKTEVAKNWMMHGAGADPADMLWYSSTEMLIRGFVKTSINPMIEVNPVLRERLGHATSDNSLSFKRFGSMGVQFAPATGSTMISKSAPRIVADEYDAICEAMGDVKPLLDVRRQTFGERSKLLCISHPDLAAGERPEDWKLGVMAVYRESTRRIWWWGCPQCGAYSSPNPSAAVEMTLHYDEAAPLDEIADMARLCCPVNGCMIEDSQRRVMNLTGKWVGTGEAIDQDGTVTGELLKRDADGYWITGLMSPFAMGGLGGLAKARVEAERNAEASGDAKPLRQVLSKQWGVPLPRRRRVGALDADVIAERAEPDLISGTVAHGVRFITVFIDVQMNRFELMARGWGAAGESWVIERRMFRAAPTVSPGDWDALLAYAVDTAWPLADGSARGMKARVVGYDTAGAPGSTQQAYAAWQRLKAAGKVRLLGKIDGRDCWSVLPMKGASGINAPRLTVVYPDGARKDRFAAARGNMPLGIFNPNLFKDDLSGQLQRAMAGAWAVHFPAALRSADAPHVFFEGLVAERRDHAGRWHDVPGAPRNEPMDLMVGCHVLAHATGQQRILWDRPPVWAAAWDANTGVKALATPVASQDGDEDDVAAAALMDELPTVAPAVMAAAVARPALGVRLINRIPLRR